MKNDILVSVVIPTYKRSTTLSRAINSVLNQTYQWLEIIVVDDNSPGTLDRRLTESVMTQYESIQNIIYIQHSQNINGSAARNTGIRIARGEYIAFLDDDDEFTCNKIKFQYEKLNALDSSWAACYTNYEIRNGAKLIAKGVEKREGELYCEALMRNLFIAAGSNLMVRKSVLLELNGFDESFKRNQDLELLVRILQKYKIAHCDVMGLIVHQHLMKKKVNFEEITLQYLDTFSSFINKLEADEQRRFFRMINLQMFRYYALTSREWYKCVSMLKLRKVSLVQICDYFIHLLYRYLYKKSCGYRLR